MQYFSRRCFVVPEFATDKTREESLKEFLHTEVYPRIAFACREVTDVDKQKEGYDAEVIFNWGTETHIIDEKAQNSNKYIGDPCPTFVLELFGESWDNRSEYGNIGWYLDESNQTDYYVFVWLPEVSLFRVNVDFNVIEYHPADSITFNPDTIVEHTYMPVNYTYKRTRSPNGFDHYKFKFTAPRATNMTPAANGYKTQLRRDIITAFDHTPDSVPVAFRDAEPITPSEWYYDPCHIHEAKVLIVQKNRIEEVLSRAGLDKQTLKQKAIDLIEDGGTSKVVQQSEAKRVIRSNHSASGCNAVETPVNLVVNYDTYHVAADKTLHYKNGTWREGVKLFHQ